MMNWRELRLYSQGYATRMVRRKLWLQPCLKFLQYRPLLSLFLQISGKWWLIQQHGITYHFHIQSTQEPNCPLTCTHTELAIRQGMLSHTRSRSRQIAWHWCNSAKVRSLVRKYVHSRSHRRNIQRCTCRRLFRRLAGHKRRRGAET